MFRKDASWIDATGLDWDRSWQHLEKRLAEGALGDMNFHGFLGPEHLTRLYNWIDRIPYPNFLNGPPFERLVALARAADLAVMDRLGLDPELHGIDAVSVYNAQDFRFQTPYQVPWRQRVRTFLDFGAGHGRQANLWLQTAPQLTTFIAVDAFPATYLTQRLYYQALGLTLNDHMDMTQQPFVIHEDPKVVNHLPSWRLDLVPDGSVDMVCAVQVLRELSRGMLRFALRQFHRILRTDGALYIRDHIGFHNVNMVDMDRVLAASGFVAEWQPALIDGKDVHGVPRIWRKPNLNAIIGGKV
ncbi:hypothetical protein BV911_18500 [Pseudoruegeria sp. SK021]|nr:hypothetical protein BV911_18500 [Pseudoruegeria sp. SK021]